MLLLDQSPLIAGCLLGLLSYKPHFILLTFFALLCGRRWKALLVMIGTTLFLSLASLAIFGYQVWMDYFKVMSIPMKLLEEGAAAWNIMPTFFSTALSLNLGIFDAYVMQGLVILVVLAGVGWDLDANACLAQRGAVLVLGILLFTPYAFIYDLAILALPLCWLWEEGRLKGRLPGDWVFVFGLADASGGTLFMA